MTPRFIVQNVKTGDVWAGSHFWTKHTIAAQWFDTAEHAELAALRELHEPRPDWRICELSEDCLDVKVLDAALETLNAELRKDLS